MLAKVQTYALAGIEALPVRVEVDLATGAFPTLAMVGLPDPAVRESRERIVAALRNQGLRYPDKKITVNLAPADLRKEGVGFDLPIAIGILVASGQAPAEHLASLAWAGELSLDGRIHPIRGSLSMAVAEGRAGESHRGAAGGRSAASGRGVVSRQGTASPCVAGPLRTLVLPRGNGTEAAAGGARIREVASLREVVRLLFNGPDAFPAPPVEAQQTESGYLLERDLADVRGQAMARRALEVAAAGGHNLLFIGSPGTGKSMLAECLPGILPPMQLRERLEATMVHSVGGLRPAGAGLMEARPFRAPHHSVSEAGLIGGGRPPRPGEISLAHHGVLFLDELPEFRRHVLEALRQPLERGAVSLVRAGAAVCFPARFQLIASMNPCLCGRRLDPRGGCTCTPRMVARYLGRLSGPLVQRIDIHHEMSSVGYGEMVSTVDAEDSATVRSRVLAAWERQRRRFHDHPRVLNNAQMGVVEIREHCRLPREALGFLRVAMGRLHLSPRAFHRVLRLARTIADLAEHEGIAEEHVAEAIAYRVLDRGAAT